MDKWLTINNSERRVRLSDIPQLSYGEFYCGLCSLLAMENYHIGHYFGVPTPLGLQLYCLVLRDDTHEVLLSSYLYDYYCEQELESVSAVREAVHPFEREITELYGVKFRNSKWDKPLRYTHDRVDKEASIADYPFYHMDGDSLHEVNVGPIHAGIIEPGAFRFICNGERVLHLEIALGYQHRGVEALISGANNLLRGVSLAESVAGDSAVAHSTAYAMAIEHLATQQPAVSAELERERAVALELERIAMHIADTGALCMDIGYQLGQVACEALRTTVINTTQLWCGNRFGKGLIRPLGSYYPITGELTKIITENLTDVKRRYAEVRDNIKVTPSVLARFEECGEVTLEQMLRIGGVGVGARASGLGRDIRQSHSWGAYAQGESFVAIVREQGDVMARLMQRSREVDQSIDYIISLLGHIGASGLAMPKYDLALEPDSLSFSFVEGWRGEICHVAMTDSGGRLEHYKIKDPSLHNWLALALAVRGEGISDFPICNKSFNLSYCGHDL